MNSEQQFKNQYPGTVIGHVNKNDAQWKQKLGQLLVLADILKKCDDIGTSPCSIQTRIGSIYEGQIQKIDTLAENMVFMDHEYGQFEIPLLNIKLITKVTK